MSATKPTIKKKEIELDILATIPIALNATLYQHKNQKQSILIDGSKGNNRDDGDYHKETSVWKDRQGHIIEIDGVRWEYYTSICITRKRRLD